MNLSLITKITVFSLLFSFELYAQSGKITVSKEPSWISKETVDYSLTELDNSAENGYINVSFEIQVSVAEKSEYVRSSKKIISQTGVQNGSEISISFDPLYEQLTFHSINIIRDGKVIDKLEPSKIKTIHQENDLEKFIYNGSLNALLILEDVRKGDIIEYSYTTKGFNPIFKGKYFRKFYLQYGVPIYRIYYKLIMPQNRSITIANHDEAVETDSSIVNGQKIFEWRKLNVKSYTYQDYTPNWYDFPHIEVSEYKSWEEVNDWATKLFPTNTVLSKAVKTKINEINIKHSTTEEQIKEALQFVQDEIRYMGIEMGVNSHKPANPSKVFSQRFGDCKEKSYLLVSMLREMGIEANPVLIDTDYKKNIFNLLPSPGAFNHTTVKVRFNDENYWFDPTISHQRGGLKNLSYPDYQAGLVLTDTTSSLTPIKYQDNSSVDVDESFFVSDMKGAGTFIVTTTCKGSFADNMRYRFSNRNHSELLRNYKKFYAYYYENIIADSLVCKDDINNGTFISIEYYTIPEFWEKTETKADAFNFSLFIINDIIRKPKDKDREMPFKITFPVKYHEKVTVNLPKDWNVTESESHIKNSCFTFNSWFHCDGDQVIIDGDYENLKDFVTIEEASTYFEDLSEIDEASGYEITSGFDFQVAEKQPISTKNIIYVFLLIIGVTITFIRWSQHKKK